MRTTACRIFIFGALLVAPVLTLAGAPKAAGRVSKKSATGARGLDRPSESSYSLAGEPARIVQDLLAVAADEAGAAIEALGAAMAVNAAKAGPILDALAAERSCAAAMAQAELLLWMARGEEGTKKPDNAAKEKPDLMSTDEVGRRAAELLDHDDPFVRGLADWAIAVRVGMENAGLRTVWPEGAGPAWYQKWLATLKPDFLLESDYVRQGTVLGVHHSTKALLKSAEEIVRRCEGPVLEIRARGAAQQRDALERNLSLLKDAQNRLAEGATAPPTDLTGQRKLWIAVRRAARPIVLATPDIDFREILFATRHAAHDGPNITGGAKSYIYKPGGDIVVKAGFSPADPVRPVLAGQLGSGHVRGMEMWWDADRLVFSWTRQPKYFDVPMIESDQGFDDKAHGLSEPMHIFEIGMDGRWLRQITDHPHNSDAEPTYLSNGDIVFVSDRSNFASQCCGNFFQNKRIVNLYRCSPDGSNLRVLSNNKDFDRYPHVLDSGQLIFTRWEYQERHLWQTHNLWTARPDGSMTDALYKQHINSGPMSLRDARQIPNSRKLVAIACGHHEWAQGAVTIVDPCEGINESAGMRIVTPRISPREGGIGRGRPVERGGIEDRGGLYQHPFALSERSFLVSYSYHLPRSSSNANNFALYFIDTWGNKELIHREPILSVVYPMPVRKRQRPPVIPDAIVPDQHHARCYVADVYSGMPEVPRGTIKYIRISQRTHWPAIPTGDRVVDYNHLHYTPSGSWASTLGVWEWTPARVIGTVPVAEDGSAYFNVPASMPVYFQALDANHMEVRRMRTFVTFQPGEVRGCTGCHETRDEAPPVGYRVVGSLRGKPAVPMPPSWSDRVFPDYEQHIQPIISRNCASCHGEKAPAGGLEFTARKVDGYCQSYRTMFGLRAYEPTPVDEVRAFMLFFPNGPEPPRNKEALKKMEKNEYPGQLISLSDRFSDASITQPMEFGSHKSRLIQALLAGGKCKLKVADVNRDEWIALVTWVDLNAPYWGSFVDKEPVRKGERPRRILVEMPPPFGPPIPQAEAKYSVIEEEATHNRSGGE